MPAHLVSLNPACGFVCLHLSLGICDFTTPPDRIDTDKLSEKSVSGVSKSLFPGQTLIITNPNNPSDNNSVIYLGKGYFLFWECFNAEFFIRTSEQLDQQLPEGVEFKLVKNVTMSSEDSPLNSLFKILAREIQKNKSPSAVNIPEYSYVK